MYEKGGEDRIFAFSHFLTRPRLARIWVPLNGVLRMGQVLNVNCCATVLIDRLLLGQVVSAEILMASEHGCPIEMHRIPIEKCDEMYDETCDGNTFMPFHRAQYDSRTGQSPNSPREQVKFTLTYQRRLSYFCRLT